METINAYEFRGIDHCPIRNVISVFSDKWSLLILTSFGNSGKDIEHYSDLQRALPECSQKMLSQTLKKLCGAHLLHRNVLPEVPPRVEYSLTPLGQSLIPHINALVGWAVDHYSEVIGK
ncbi:MAG: winged helix-turn-helix transcriptional regulator [Prevotella sp.]|jgi:DNA-binding HxlR family transcriptional regulator